MREKRFASVLMGLFLLCLLCFPIACAVNPVTGEHQLMLLSEEEEIRLGHKPIPGWSANMAFTETTG